MSESNAERAGFRGHRARHEGKNRGCHSDDRRDAGADVARFESRGRPPVSFRALMPIADALRSAELSWFASQVWKLRLGAIDAKLADTALQMALSPRNRFVQECFPARGFAVGCVQVPNS